MPPSKLNASPIVLEQSVGVLVGLCYKFQIVIIIFLIVSIELFYMLSVQNIFFIAVKAKIILFLKDLSILEFQCHYEIKNDLSLR